MTELTCKQFKVYEFVKGHIKDKQYPPTYKEIANEFSISVKSAHDYIKAIERKEKVLGTEHPSTATSYNNIGEVYREQGNYGKALEYHLKALATREKVLGTEHSDTAQSYNNIGLVYYEQGDYSKALEYHQKALAIMSEHGCLSKT